MHKKFIIWLCLGFYLLLGAGNLSAVAFCSGYDSHIGINILGYEACCKDSHSINSFNNTVKYNDSEKNLALNNPSCNECQDFFIKSNNLEQSITYTQNQFNNLIADISGLNAREIDFNATFENNIFLPDYKPLTGNNLNMLKTVVLII